MTTRTLLAITGLALALASFGCEEKKAETTKAADAAKSMTQQAKDAGAKAVEATKEGVAKAVDATKEGAAKAVEATKEGATKAVEATKEAVKETTAKAVAAVSDEAKTAMKGYIDSLGESTGILSKIKSPMDASQLKPLGESLAKNAGYATTLDKLSPDVKGSMKSDFGSSLDGAMKAFTEQKDRIMKDASLSKVFGDTLAKFKSFSL